MSLKDNLKLESLKDPKTAALAVLATLGVVSLLKSTKSVLSNAYRLFLKPFPNLSKNYGKNTWVFITGGSNGLGQAYSRILASKGFNCIITGRHQDTLIIAKKQLEDDFGI